MRKALDALYGGALAGACLAFATIAVLVMVQVLGRVIDRVADWIGAERLGIAIPSLAEIGGFLFVAAAFLALPATLRGAGHVRVTLALRFFGPTGERLLTACVLLLGLGLAGFAAWFLGVQALASFERGSVSYGLIPIPLWVPQAAMTFGVLLFALALFDEFLASLRGEPAFREAERAREASEGGH